MNILAVDDNSEQGYLLENMLRGAGYHVVLARNGTEALAQLTDRPFDLIISDVLMPKMDGFELCRQVMKREDLRRIPFVFYTATYTEKKDEKLGLSLGASKFIMKPVEPEEFLAAIRKVIRECKTGKLQPATPVPDEHMLLETHNERLVQKLEKKIDQLQAITEALHKEVAERRKAEEQVRKLNAELEQRVSARTHELAIANQDLQTFASAVSHDLRAPLRAIEGLSQILARSFHDHLDESGVSVLNSLHAQTARMDRLIDALLRLSRVTRSEIKHQTVDLTEAAREIVRELRKAQPERSVEFLAAPGLRAEGDPVLLRAALQNLLSNAWKFTAGTPHARIEFGRSLDGAKTVYFVRDNGAGFNMAAATQLFEPFRRLHSDSQFPGTGIGLTTVRQIIRRHGGEVWAEGAVNRGATFYFTLPQNENPAGGR
ncbi:MAG TPA: response regulator [Clostridia bacterium]|nr:response regulator [Clostridia bacterium]